MDSLLLKVTRIHPEGGDAATVFLERVDGLPVEYRAGQFLTFIFPKGNTTIRRSYSISSTPGVDEWLSVTVKRIPNGEISRQLLDHLQPGDLLEALPPAGRFTIETGPGDKHQFFFIAAGSGMVPVFSLLKKLLTTAPLCRVVLIDQNHDEQAILFSKPLHELLRRYPAQFTWINVLSKPGKGHHTPQRLTKDMLEALIDNHISPGMPTFFYLCGPADFMRMTMFTLKVSGYHDEQIRKENFVVDHIPPPPLISDRLPKQITIHYNLQTYHIQAAYPTNILQAALDHHIRLPYSCRGGRCSACMAKCVSGSVKMSINEVLTENDLKEGWILTCVGFAETDVEIEV